MKVQLIERCRKVAEAGQLRLAEATLILDELMEIKEAAYEYLEGDTTWMSGSLHELMEAVAKLSVFEIGLSREQVAELVGCVDRVQTALDLTDGLDDLTNAVDRLEAYLALVEEHRDDPSGYDREEKSDARDSVRECMSEIADLLEEMKVD